MQTIQQELWHKDALKKLTVARKRSNCADDWAVLLRTTRTVSSPGVATRKPQIFSRSYLLVPLHIASPRFAPQNVKNISKEPVCLGTGVGSHRTKEARVQNCLVHGIKKERRNSANVEGRMFRQMRGACPDDVHVDFDWLRKGKKWSRRQVVRASLTASTPSKYTELAVFPDPERGTATTTYGAHAGMLAFNRLSTNSPSPRRRQRASGSLSHPPAWMCSVS